MALALTLSYVVHVVSAAFWTGGVLYAAYAVFPPALTGDLSPAAFERHVDGLLRVTRWTGLALPVSGVYQVWLLYPLPRLLGTTAGYLVLGMAALWTLMNGVVELGVYRMRQLHGDPPGIGAYMARGFSVDESADVARLAGAGRPYLLGAAALSVLLLVDAALLAGGLAA
jgi:uncharacterized membrane protein